MAITHFEITELPDGFIVESLINGSPISINTDYPIADQNQVVFNKRPEYSDISVIVPFYWKIKDNVNNVESQETISYLNFYEKDLSNNAAGGNNQSTTIENNETLNLKEELDRSKGGTPLINDATTYVLIERIESLNLWTKNNQALLPGDRINTTEFKDVDFLSKSEGGGFPYSKLVFKAGNPFALNNTEIELNLNVIALAELALINTVTEIYDDEFEDPGTVTYSVTEEIFDVQINTGHVNKTAEFSIQINSPFLALNNFNEIIVRTNSETIKKQINETFNVIVELDNLGKANINFENYIVFNNADPKIGEITITLLNVNNDINLVSNSNNVLTLNTNL